MDRYIDSFLQHVASSLKNKFGDNLSRVAVVFPNKRANLFLNEYLVTGNEVMWAPTYMTISELFTSLSHLQIADPVDVVCRLYKHYAKATNSNESLDYFYGWGERLLADFDDLDKNLGDADKIFRDLREYQEIGAYDEILDEDQIAQLRKFAGDFSVKDRSKIRERFMQLWEAMLPLYKGLKEDLVKDGMAYEGQLYRDVLERLKRQELALPTQFDYYAFVGFNVLDSVEKELFKLLQAEGKALFYWDYDVHYVNNSDPLAPTEAGVFLQENLKTFPNELANDTGLYNNLTGRSETKLGITFVAADTDAIQAQYVDQWLSTRCDGKLDSNEARQTAIVLCDEGQLLPVLHALPKSKGYDVNITKGFPLTHTPAYASVIRFMNEMLYDQNVRRCKLPEGTKLMPLQQSEAMDKLLVIQQLVKNDAVDVRKKYKIDDWKNILYTESYFQIYTIISRFVKLIETGTLSTEGTNNLYIGLDTLFKLLKQVMRSQTIPFHGEPAVGLQIMGVLETRCLDFKHVLMLSVGEGILPQKATDASFIPFLIRKRYGLTTYLRKTAVYAYYFYRLMQRAQDVTLVYNNSTSGTHRGEMSRFMRSMHYDPQLGKDIKRYHLKSVPRPLSLPELKICTNAENMEQPFRNKFSPSALNTYLSCNRMFYYQYIKHLRKPDDTDGIIDPRDLGTVFHYAAQLFYESVGTQRIESKSLRNYLEDRYNVQLQDIVRKAFLNPEKPIERTPLVETIVNKFLHDTIKYDSGEFNTDKALTLNSLEFIAAEHYAEVLLKVPFGKEDNLVDIKLYGEIDRLDLAELEGVGRCLRVVDYKTGGSSVEVKNMEHMFNHQQKEDSKKEDSKKKDSKKKDPKHPFQTFAYCLLVHESPEFSQYKSLPLVPALYYVHHFQQKGFNPYISFEGKSCTDFRAYAEEFKSKLIGLLSEIIDPKNPFECTNNKDTCKYCDFCDMCGRNS